MKKYTLLLLVAVISLMTSCTTVQSGHKGVEISWGGETNLNVVYPEGMDNGFHWIWDDMIEYYNLKVEEEELEYKPRILLARFQRLCINWIKFKKDNPSKEMPKNIEDKYAHLTKND